VTETDGRRLRGERRRADLLRAVLRIVERDGVSGVSHRAVAAEAGASLASTTYHYATLDELLVAALTAAAADFATDLRERFGELRGIDRPTAEPATEVYAVLRQFLEDRRGPTLAEYELYLLAARRPALRDAAAAWLDPLTDLAERLTADPGRARLLVAALDGVLLQSLIGVREFDREDLETLLATFTRAGAAAG
jgi:DNA-binding transcriptional regulator YbjK